PPTSPSMKVPHLMAMLALGTAPFAYSQIPAYALPGETGGLFAYLPIPQCTEYADGATLAVADRFLSDTSVAIYSDFARRGSGTLSFYNIVPEDIDYGPDTGQPGVTPGALADFKPDVAPLWTSGPTLVSFAGGGSTGLNLNELVFADI